MARRMTRGDTVFRQIKRRQLQNFTNSMNAASAQYERGDKRMARTSLKFAIAAGREYYNKCKARGEVVDQLAWKERQKFASSCLEAIQ
jgi:hypothetical protein